MPRIIAPLTKTQVERLIRREKAAGGKRPRQHAVGGVPGLRLQVSPKGTTSWILRYKIGAKSREMGLGGFPERSLDEARGKARQYRDMVGEGIDPIEHQKQKKRRLIAEQLATITFAEAAEEYIKMREKEFSNPRQAAQWRSSLKEYASAKIGKTPVREIELLHIKSVLDPIWETKTETATRVRSRMENILGWCAINGYRSGENPARWQGYLDEVYPSPEKIKKKRHHAALPVEQMKAFLADLRANRSGNGARALEFLILTAARSKEVRFARWGEIDWDQELWIVPAEHMKGRKEHRVPLSGQALDLLRNQGEGKSHELIFPGARGGEASDMTLTKVIRDMQAAQVEKGKAGYVDSSSGRTATAHGFRAAFRTWAQEYKRYGHELYAEEVCELALAHVNNDATRAAYARGELVDERRALMREWADFCTPVDNVVELEARK